MTESELAAIRERLNAAKPDARPRTGGASGWVKAARAKRAAREGRGRDEG